MLLEEHKSLKEYNTFGIECQARYFVSVDTIGELKQALSNTTKLPIFILGGGSNVLITKDMEAYVIHLNLKGIQVISETLNEINIQVMAGENWHEFVLYCLDQNYGGIENLSLIPGNVGTAPIQNIGAYGVELKDVFVSCNTLEIANQTFVEFDKEDCQFDYRNSVFKNEGKGKYIICSLTLCLTKKDHNLQVSYGAIKEKLIDKNIEKPNIKDISNAIISIRQSKLPDPAELGNSGSFFKNPILDKEAFKIFRRNNPKAPFYEVSSFEFKIPAAWLIEQAGFKGKQFGDAGVHSKQALVLVNHGNASGNEIWKLAEQIQEKVKEQFGIYIQFEVNII